MWAIPQLRDGLPHSGRCLPRHCIGSTCDPRYRGGRNASQRRDVFYGARHPGHPSQSASSSFPTSIKGYKVVISPQRTASQYTRKPNRRTCLTKCPFPFRFGSCRLPSNRPQIGNLGSRKRAGMARTESFRHLGDLVLCGDGDFPGLDINGPLSRRGQLHPTSTDLDWHPEIP